MNTKRLLFLSTFAGLLALSWFVMPPASRGFADQVSGQGKLRFRVLYTSTHLPPEAQKVLKAAHGGFAFDRRPGKGEMYFALPGAGIIQISADLKKTKMITTAPEMRDTNMHNALYWESPGGDPYLSFPANQANRVFTTTLDGKLVNTLAPPEPNQDLGNTTVNSYFANKGAFIPTDLEMLDGLFYIATGYSKLDYVLTARIKSFKPLSVDWYDLSFGGKGDGVGQFGTGHGITIRQGTKRIDVSDRPHSEIDRFNRHGQYLSTLSLPKGSLPCDIQYLGQYAIVGALDGPDKSKGAPIYILEDDQVVSTILVKDELGLPNFTHVHNAALREINGKLYVIAQAWNPGDFAILEQVN
jgi:hypothetical protein